MSNFAKIFDVADTQVLYVLKRNDDGFPCVETSTSIEGVHVTLSAIFNPKDERLSWNEELAWDSAKNLFSKKRQKDAEGDYLDIKKVFKGE